jgi:hypothetical protein
MANKSTLYIELIRKFKLFCINNIGKSKNGLSEKVAIQTVAKALGLKTSGSLYNWVLYEYTKHGFRGLKVDFGKKYEPIKKRRANHFYDSEAWQTLRVLTLKKYGCKCMKCGATNTEVHVDHIKPRSKYPELELSLFNLQVLCKKCNLNKSNKNEIDYRPFI